jgi:hypothetical protein
MFRFGAAPVAPKRHRIGKCFAAHVAMLTAKRSIRGQFLGVMR